LESRLSAVTSPVALQDPLETFDGITFPPRRTLDRQSTLRGDLSDAVLRNAARTHELLILLLVWYASVDDRVVHTELQCPCDLAADAASTKRWLGEGNITTI
jgi:hypothetical protein